MKKLWLIIALFATTLLVACQSTSNIKIEIINLQAQRTSMSFDLEVTDPDEELTPNLITVVIYYDGKEITRKSPSLSNGEYSVTFDGLSIGYTYTVNVYASYDGKNHKMASSKGTTTTLGGSETEPKLIQTIDDFKNIKNDLTAYYKLMNDLDFENANFQNALGSSAFNGKFDGNGKTIKNLKMEALTTYTGLFGYNKGTIKNLVIENVTLNLKSSSQYIGILSGRNAGIIENVTLKDSSFTTVFSRTGEIFLGGLVGYSEPSSQIKDTKVENLTMSVTTSGRTEPYVGLLVGRAKASKISNVESSGTLTVNSSDSSYIGGLIGSLDNDYQVKSKLENAKSTVDITVDVTVAITLITENKVDAPASVYVGGLLGANRNSDIYYAYANADILIKNLSNNAVIQSDDDQLAVGGLIGSSNNVVTEGLATGSITLGEVGKEVVTAFEDIYLAGLIGYQAPDRISKGVSLNFDINVIGSTLDTLRVSNVIGNNVTANAAYFGGTIQINDVSYEGQIVYNFANDTIVTLDNLELDGEALESYFESDFVNAILDQVLVN